MSNNKNYNHNRHDKTDNNRQRQNDVHGGELRKGRKSQFKNNNPEGAGISNEFVTDNQ